MKRINQTSMRSITSMPGSQSGFSLVELMIASVIGLVVLSGVVTIFSSNSASSKMSTSMSRIQDSGRVALDIMSFNTRMAGYEGCRDDTKEAVVPIARDFPTIANYPDSAIWGTEVSAAGTWTNTHPDLGSITALAMPDTDVFYVQNGSGRAVNLAQDMSGGGANVVLDGNPDQLTAGDLLMIASCDTTNIFRATDVDDQTGGTIVEHNSGTTGNIQGNLTEAFTGVGNKNAVPVRVMRFEAKAYFIGDSGRNMPNGNAIHSLFVLDTTLTGPKANLVPTELIEGVENLQVLYGEDIQTAEGAPPSIRYVTGDNITDPGKVVSVQLGLLVGSTDYAAQSNDTGVYHIAGTVVGPPGNSTNNSTHRADRRFRAAFNTTIQLRNRNL